MRARGFVRPSPTLATALLLALAAVTGTARAADPNACDLPTDEPDVIVGDIDAITRWGSLDGITAYSFSTWSCNVGTCWLNWIDDTNEHPVITQNLYRLKDDKFEHIGQAWLKHGFYALSDELCDAGCIPTDGAHLGVNCADPYSAGLNGQQSQLGPKFEVNATTGDFPYPFTGIGLSGDAIYKRLQVHNDDLDPALNPAAGYFVESQYICSDDAAHGNDNNNSSYRPVTVSGAAGVYNLNLAGTTVREYPALFAWAASNPLVKLQVADVPGDGRFVIGETALDLGGGMWRYEYAVLNYNSHRSAGSFAVPVPYGLELLHVEFHDVDYHSGEPYSGEDWTAVIDEQSIPNRLVWSTVPHALDPNANALRFNTLYNFRFECARAPDRAGLTLGLWRPGAPTTVAVAGRGPRMCNANGACEPGETTANCPSDCIGPCGNGTCDVTESPCSCSGDCGLPPVFEALCHDGLDDDCDTHTDCADLDCCIDAGCPNPDGDGDFWGMCEDCDDADDRIWAAPAECLTLEVTDGGAGETILNWSPPTDPGSDEVAFDVLRSSDPRAWATGMLCLADGDPGDLQAIDSDLPPAGSCYYYLVRATNACPAGEGAIGTCSDGTPRVGGSCR